MFENITVAQLRRAIAIKEQMQSLESELSGILDGSTSNGRRTGRPPGRRKMSAAGRARIAAAQKARWAKVHGTAVTPKKGRRKMSAAAKAKLSAAAKKRWARAKAAGKKAL